MRTSRRRNELRGGGDKTKQTRWREKGGEIGEEIFKRRGSSTMPQHKIVALLFVLHTLLLPLKHIFHCARSIEIERCRCMDTERREGGEKQLDVVRRQTVTFVVVTTGMSAAKAASRGCAVSCVRPGQQALMTGGQGLRPHHCYSPSDEDDGDIRCVER
ncbi:hypothetical protein MRX96_006384 [Rhipicephalus microplus]